MTPQHAGQPQETNPMTLPARDRQSPFGPHRRISPALLHALEIDSPLGRLRLCARDDRLCGVYLPAQAAPGAVPAPDHPVLLRVAAQLREYFAGTRRAFDVPLHLAGTDFQQTVWRALTQIPFAATRSYGHLAAAIDRPGASRAVGSANSMNPISIIVPCHRVIGRDGALTGYAGGAAAKRWLLDHEAAHAVSQERDERA
jgi:methylated-DNA-[protein]-cysteine S-methyltransferase